MGDSVPDFDEWLRNHHIVELGVGGEPTHVFAIECGDVYTEKSATKTWEISFGLSPLTIRLVVGLNTITKALNICANGKIPFLPEFQIGCGDGTLDKGVIIKFNSAVVTGSFTFFVKDGWLWLYCDSAVLGKGNKGDIKLIPLPT